MLKFLATLLCAFLSFAGASMDFNGSSDKVDLPTSPTGIDLTDDITYVAWIYPHSVSDSYRIVVGKGNSGLPQELKFYKISAVMSAYVGGIENASTSMSQDTWYNVGLTITGDSYEHFNNAATDGSGTLDNSRGTSTKPLRIGGDPAGSTQEFNGLICYVQIHTAVLSQSEIANVMWLPGSVGQLGVFTALWGTVDPTPDLSGNGNTGSWVGPPDEAFDGPPVMFGGGLPL